MKKINKILGIAVILIISLALAGCGLKDITGKFLAGDKEDVPDKAAGAVAIINGEEIDAEYFERQYEMISSRYEMYGMEISKTQLLEDAMIPQLILVQEAKEEGIEVTKTEVNEFVDAEMEKVMQSLPEEQLQEELDKLGITIEELKEDNRLAYTTQLYIERLLNKTVWSGIEVSINEVEDYYDNNPEVFRTPDQVRASHILVDTEEEAEDILKALEDGESFAELAKDNSNDPGSAAQGGDLGYFSSGMMVPEFEEAAFSMKVGQISDSIATQFGYHIIKVTAAKPAGKLTFTDVKDEIEEQLKIGKQKAAEDTYIEQLKKKAEIEILLNEETEAAEESESILTIEESDEEVVIEEE